MCLRISFMFPKDNTTEKPLGIVYQFTQLCQLFKVSLNDIQLVKRPQIHIFVLKMLKSWEFFILYWLCTFVFNTLISCKCWVKKYFQSHSIIARVIHFQSFLQKAFLCPMALPRLHLRTRNSLPKTLYIPLCMN